MTHDRGILYPALVTAAIAVTILSAVGVAALTGAFPKELSGSVPARQTKPVDAPAAKSEPPAKATPAPRSAPASGGRTRIVATPACPTCGVIESVRAFEFGGQVSGTGAVAGGRLGGVVGNQFGCGNGHAAMTALGAAGGAHGGHAIVRNLQRTVGDDVRIRLDDGSVRTLQESTMPDLRAADRVHISEGRAVREG
jgi:outer membrane lipoprotein SlyB